MPDITSRQHAIVRAFKAAAQGDRERILLDGWHLLHEAVAAGLELETVAVAGSPPSSRDAELLNRLSRERNVVTVTSAVMNAMSPVRTPSGVAALGRRRQYTIDDALRPPPALVLIAADIQDPGNVGAIVRSAEAGGATGVAFVGASADPWNWKALRAAMGSTFRLPVLRTSNVDGAINQLRTSPMTLLATVPQGGVMLHETNLRRPVAIMLGSEGGGLSEALLAAADERITIPMRPPVESLNVAVAAALLVYEVRRQRQV